MDPKTGPNIAEALKEEIELGRLGAGAVLRQDDLAKRFGVSRQPVRLALERLRESGLVAPRKDRSVEVTDLSDAARRDLVDLRILVECEALRLAIPQQTERSLLDARQIQERLEIEREPKPMEELDSAFHRALYAPGGNARLLALVQTLRGEDRRAYLRQARHADASAAWARQHRALLERCQAGDTAGAVETLRSHLQAVRQA